MLIPALGLTFSSNESMKKTLNLEVCPKKSPFLSSYIVNGQLYLTIPNEVLDTPVLFIRYDQHKTRKFIQIVWSLHKDNILLKTPSIASSAGNIIPVANNLPLEDNLIAIFPLENSGTDIVGHTINITDLVLRQTIEWTPGFTENLLPEITMLMDARNRKNEVIIKTRRGLRMGKSKIALPVFYAFSALPKPMNARRYDYRMGFYDEFFTAHNYGTENRKANITKWRLQKRNNTKEIDVPTDPITFILSPDIPKKWRPYVKAGIEEWLPAFEAAGFKDALVVKEVDSINEWQLHSIAHSIVFWDQRRYLRGNEHEDTGGTISKILDLRSGEVLRCDIHLGSTIEVLSEKYFIRAAPLDRRARKFPFPDELTGSLLQNLTAHEAGHAFGIMDGNFGEYTYPFHRMTDSLWLSTMGYTPSIMNYTRFNNIPQPEDRVPPSLLVSKVGPTDFYNIRWGYSEFAKEKDVETELERIVRIQDSVPWYRYNNDQFEVIGPAATNEVVETDNPICSTEMALKNLKRVIELLPDANRDQKDNARLERLYSKVLGLWHNQMNQVVSLIGGYDIHYSSINQPGNLYTPIPWQKQEKAIDFLIMNAFDPPKWLTEPEFHQGTHYSTFPDEMVGFQQNLIFELIDTARLKRMEQMELIYGQKKLLNTYVLKIQTGLFNELKNSFDNVPPRKQEIQLTYIDRLTGILGKERLNYYPKSKFSDYTDYSKGILLQQLLSLKKEIEIGLKTNEEVPTAGHWKRCLLKINSIPNI